MMLKKSHILVMLLLVLTAVTALSQPVQRFPKPDFESGYEQQTLQTPGPRSQTWEIIDIAVLFVSLSLATWLALKKRSRKLLFALMLFTLAYFGFWREGCICAVGSFQNVAYAFSHPEYAIPVSAVFFFALPLLFALFYGRTFCAAVCPLGAIQDFVMIKPTRVPRWLGMILGMIPYLYLGLAVMFAVLGAGFIVCQYDPFVGIFRFGGNFDLILLGGVFLLLGTVVGRPYCRFLCPYGVLLGWMSRLSKKHVTITPDECIHCRLCEDSCPFNAIDEPTDPVPDKEKAKGGRQLLVMILLIPLFMLTFGWTISRLDVPLSKQHHSVALAEQIKLENNGLTTETTDASDAFRASGRTTEDLFTEAVQIRRQFRAGGWWLGGFLGLVFGLQLVFWSRKRKQVDYEPNRTRCLSCGRCFMACPREHVRLKS